MNNYQKKMTICFLKLIYNDALRIHMIRQPLRTFLLLLADRFRQAVFQFCEILLREWLHRNVDRLEAILKGQKRECQDGAGPYAIRGLGFVDEFQAGLRVLG